MATNDRRTLMTTFGTMLKPVNTDEGLFALKVDSEALMDTPLPDYKGTKQIFRKGSTVRGTLWIETARNGKYRRVVMVQEPNKGRYLINAKDLEPTTDAKVVADQAKKDVDSLTDRVEELLEKAKDSGKELVKTSEGILEKKYVGFTGKQILVATIGVIVLIKIFK